LQDRTASSLLTVCLLGLLFFFLTPLYFWRAPSHLLFTYLVPVVPMVLVFDGYVSSLRTRSPAEIRRLMDTCGTDADGWTVTSGQECHTYPIGYMNWFIAVKE
jgi:hypothetical protein